MPRVDFYILQDEGVEARNRFACRLMEKAYLQGEHVYLHCNDSVELEQLDKLLWTFRDISFVPHARTGEETAEQAAVVLGHENIPADENNILLNFASDVPDDYQRFQRIIEIVPQEPTLKQRLRDHYRTYRDAECELTTHEI